MWVSKSEFESLKARVRELENESRIKVWDDCWKRNELITFERAFSLLLSALRAKLECFDSACTVSLEPKGVHRYSVSKRKPVVFSSEEILELLLDYLNVELDKLPASPEKSIIKPKGLE